MNYHKIKKINYWSDIFRIFSEPCDWLCPRAPLAMSHGGLCVYAPAFENAGLSPQEHTRLRVIPGGISWGSRVYQTINRMEGVFHYRRERNHAPEFRHFLSTHSFIPSANLILRETLYSTTLEAAIDLVPNNISKRPLNARTHDYISSPIAYPVYMDLRSFLYGFDGISMVGSDIMDSLPQELVVSRHCLQGSINVLAHSASNGSQCFHADSCRDVESALFASREKSAYHKPKFNEWVLTIGDQDSLVIVRSGITMLYYLFSLAQKDIPFCLSHMLTRLARMGQCLLCLVKYASGGVKKDDSVTILTIYNGQYECFHLLDQWCDPGHGKLVPDQTRILKRKRDDGE